MHIALFTASEPIPAWFITLAQTVNASLAIYHHLDDLEKTSMDAIFWYTATFDPIIYARLLQHCSALTWFIAREWREPPRLGGTWDKPLWPLIVGSDPEEIRDILAHNFPHVFSTSDF